MGQAVEINDWEFMPIGKDLKIVGYPVYKK